MAENGVQKIVRLVDEVQQDNGWAAFPYAVVKKYGDDQSGYLGAIMTYYGFLSLFPLLIVATSLIDIFTRSNEALREKLFSGISKYMPVVGDQLQSTVHSSSKTGIALILGLLVTLWGAKGVADAVQHAVNQVWEVPKQKRPSFPKGPLKSFALIFGGGIGFIVTAVLSGFATAALGRSIYFRLLPILFSFVMLIGVFIFIFNLASSAKHSWRQLLPGAVFAAFCMQVLQLIGTALIQHQLHNMRGVYGQFGLVLAILFWIYLQAQIFLYACQINAVRAHKLYPRSITQKPLTDADRRAYKLYAKRETYKAPPEHVKVEFEEDKS